MPRRGDVWSVVAATARAYPLQLSPSIERAKAVWVPVPGRPLAELWALQAAADGALAPFVAGLRKQPHILTAYAPGAPLRDPKASAELEGLAAQLQVRRSQCSAHRAHCCTSRAVEPSCRCEVLPPVRHHLQFSCVAHVAASLQMLTVVRACACRLLALLTGQVHIAL